MQTITIKISVVYIVTYTASLLRPLPLVHVINFGDDTPSAIDLDERVKICVVGADRIILHVDTHHSRRWRNSEYVYLRLDVRCGSIFLNKVIEVLDRAAEHLVIGEAVHYGLLVKSLRDFGDAADAQTLDIFGNSGNDVFIILSRYSLGIL